MFYDLAIVIYDFIVHLLLRCLAASPEDDEGHWVVYELYANKWKRGTVYLVSRCFVGEFEQGRPLMKMIREKYPNYKILLTFFLLPVMAQALPGADIVCYLPFDKPRNVKKFLDIANPCAWRSLSNMSFGRII